MNKTMAWRAIGRLTIFLLLIVTPFGLSNFFQNSANATTKESVIKDPTVWTQDNAPVIIDDETYIFESDLTIKEGVNIFLKNNSQIIVKGNFLVEGTSAGAVSFSGLDKEKAENYSVYAQGNKTEIFNAEFSFGGRENCVVDAGKSFFAKVFAQECTAIAALNVFSENVKITNSQFKYNVQALNILGENSQVQLDSNTFQHSKRTALHSRSAQAVDARYNCWMRPSGPRHENNPDGKGEQIVGETNFSYWTQCGSEFKPVIVIPGIGGSWNWEVMLENSLPTNNWNFSPGFHGYDNLVQSFKDRGYQENRDFFVAYYDWRKDNHQSMEEFLKPVLEKIKEVSFDEKFDIIAHSMGGLVALDYLYDDSYGGEIDKVVLEGTPLLGSSKIYPVWEGGEIPDDWSVMENYLWIISKKNQNKEKSYYDLIHEYFPSAKQLLPAYNYIVKNENAENIDFWQMQEQNEYILQLMQKMSENMGNFAFENILMLEGTGVNTSKMVNVDDYDGEDSDKLWKDGKPNPYPLEKNIAEGDGTVLNESSGGLPFIASKQIGDANHVALPTLALNEMSDFFEIERPNKEYQLASEDQLILAFACPVDVRIVSPDGKVVSKNENTFDEGKAYYYSDGKDDGYKILEIQDPQQGSYQIELTGNGDGNYDAFVYRTDGENSKSAEFSGAIDLEGKVEYQISVADVVQGIQLEELRVDNTPPAVTITSPESKDYFNSEIVDVEIQMQDDVSVPENITAEAILDNEVFVGEKITLPLLSLGNHELKITAKDEAGNLSETSAVFTSKASIDSLIKNVDFFFEQGLITKKAETQFLKNHLWQIKQLIDHKKHALEQFGFFSKQIRQLEKVFDKIIDGRIEFLIKMIEKKMIKGIDPIASQRLIEGLEEIR